MTATSSWRERPKRNETKLAKSRKKNRKRKRRRRCKETQLEK